MVTTPKNLQTKRSEVALYILQASLFSFEELLKMEPENRLTKIFSTLDFAPILKELNNARGPRGRNKAAMLRALVAMRVEGIPTVVKLVERLKTDLMFRYFCGFRVTEPAPDESTFSRLFAKISESEKLTSVFRDLVAKGQELGIIGNQRVAIDSTKLDAYEKARPKSNETEGERAAWGSKRDTHGNQIAWFGYKAHIAVDCQSELPVAVEISPANKADSDFALPLIEQLTQSWPQKEWPRYYIMDAGYDTKNIYEVIRNMYHAQAIIPLNLRGSKEPPEGFDFDGTPKCSMGYRMVYWGCDRKTGTNKFRCPHVIGKVDCPSGSAWCSESSYGLVVKTKVKDDPRKNCLPHRGTKQWQSLYDQRTAVERCFARLKGHLGANTIRVRKLKKVKAHFLLSCLALIAGTIAVNQSQKSAGKAA